MLKRFGMLSVASAFCASVYALALLACRLIYTHFAGGPIWSPFTKIGLTVIFVMYGAVLAAFVALRFIPSGFFFGSGFVYRYRGRLDSDDES